MLLYFLKFVLSFCSINYELLLAQTLSAFLENTVLRYSVTIGLYLCSMGLGVVWFESRWKRLRLIHLFKTELFITSLGVSSIFALFIFSHSSRFFLLAIAHFFIISIGFLTGLELPFFLKYSKNKNSILAVDYLGAFIGIVVFAFYFYPYAGILLGYWLTGLLNLLAAAILLVLARQESLEFSNRKFYIYNKVALFILALFILGICFYHKEILYVLTKYYLTQ